MMDLTEPRIDPRADLLFSDEGMGWFDWDDAEVVAVTRECSELAVSPKPDPAARPMTKPERLERVRDLRGMSMLVDWKDERTIYLLDRRIMIASGCLRRLLWCS